MSNGLERLFLVDGFLFSIITIIIMIFLVSVILIGIAKLSYFCHWTALRVVHLELGSQFYRSGAHHHDDHCRLCRPFCA